MIKIIIKHCIAVKGLPQSIIEDVQADLTFDNPVYISAKREGRWIPQGVVPYIYLYQMTGDIIYTPKGYMNNLLYKIGKKEHTIIDHAISPELVTPITFTSTLRDYQEAATKDILPKRYSVLEAATGAGKTAIGINIISVRNVRTLVLVHSKELLNQWQSALKKHTNIEKIGAIGDSKFDIQDVTIGIIQSVKNNIDKLQGQFGQVIADECFVAGTLVDDVPIESLRIGDYVRSFNHRLNKVEYKKIKYIFKNEIKNNLLRIQFSNGKQIVCTKDHPFFTPYGYLTAGQLHANSTVYSTEKSQLHRSPRRLKNERKYGCSKKFVSTKIKKQSNGTLQNMLYASRSYTGKSKTSSTLLKRMCSKIHTRSSQKISRVSTQIQCGALQQPYESKQSHAQAWDYRKNENNKENKWYSERLARNTWRQRENHHAATGYDASSGVALRGAHTHALYKNTTECIKIRYVQDFRSAKQIGIKLQNRYSKPKIKVGYRNRWERAQPKKRETFRSKKGYVLIPVRVDNIEVYECGNRSGFGEVSKISYVYNLEVETNNNYFAENILVHNCHRVFSSSWVSVLNSLNAKYVLGLSATPYRREKFTTKGIYFLIGPKVHVVDKKYLTDIGAVLIPRVIRHPTGFRTDRDTTTAGYSELISMISTDESRNRVIVNAIIKDITTYKEPVMIVSDRVAHCEALLNMLQQYRIVTPILLTGGKPAAYRKWAVEQLTKGESNTLISTTSLLGEGFDSPILNALFLCTPVKFEGRIVQVVGRILRPSKCQELPRLIDFRDNNVEMLLRSGWARDSVYKRAGWNT